MQSFIDTRNQRVHQHAESVVSEFQYRFKHSFALPSAMRRFIWHKVFAHNRCFRAEPYHVCAFRIAWRNCCECRIFNGWRQRYRSSSTPTRCDSTPFRALAASVSRTYQRSWQLEWNFPASFECSSTACVCGGDQVQQVGFFGWESRRISYQNRSQQVSLQHQ